MYKKEIVDIERKINVGLLNYSGKTILSKNDIFEIIGKNKDEKTKDINEDLSLLDKLEGKWFTKESGNNEYYVKFSNLYNDLDIKDVLNKHIILKKYDDHISTISSLDIEGQEISEGDTLIDASDLSDGDKRQVIQRISLYFLKTVIDDNPDKDGYIGLVLGESGRDFGHYFYLINSFLDQEINEDGLKKVLNIELVHDVKTFQKINEGGVSGIDINLKLLKQNDYFEVFKLLQGETFTDKEKLKFETDDVVEKKDVKYKLRYFLEIDKKSGIKAGLSKIISKLQGIIGKGGVTGKGTLKIKNGYKWNDLFNSNLHFPFKVLLKKGSKKSIINNIDDKDYFDGLFNKFLLKFDLGNINKTKNNINRDKLKTLVGLVEDYSIDDNNEGTNDIDKGI